MYILRTTISEILFWTVRASVSGEQVKSKFFLIAESNEADYLVMSFALFGRN